MGKKADAKRGRKMIYSAMMQTCGTCPAKTQKLCRANMRCFIKFLRNLERIQETATP